MSEYHPIPQPGEIPQKERDDAMGAYLMMFAALVVGLPLPIMNLIGAIIYVAVNKSSRFVKYHGLHSLYAQIPLTFLNIGFIIWGITLIVHSSSVDDVFFGFLALVILSNLLYVIFSIVALIKARRGEMYYFIFFGKIAYHHAFRVKGSENMTRVNAPPKM